MERPGRGGRLGSNTSRPTRRPLVAHRFRQRRVIDHLAARGVEQDRAGLEPRQHRRPDELLRLRRHREVQRQHVAAGGELDERRRQGHAHVALALAEPHRVHSSAVSVSSRPSKRRLHRITGMSKARARRITSRRDGAGAGDAERLAGQPARLGVELLVPGAGAQIGDVVGDAAIDGEQQREGQLGDRDRVLAGAVRDVDAARRRGLDVDGVVAGAGADDQRQAPGVEHRLGDLGGCGRPAPRRRRADRLDQRGVLQVGLDRGPRSRRPSGPSARSPRTHQPRARAWGLQPGPAGRGNAHGTSTAPAGRGAPDCLIRVS